VVVVNSSVFCPTPSLAAQLMNHLNLSPKTLHYNLGGMGCAGKRKGQSTTLCLGAAVLAATKPVLQEHVLLMPTTSHCVDLHSTIVLIQSPDVPAAFFSLICKRLAALHRIVRHPTCLHFSLAASPISVELAQQALLLRPGSYALVVSTEVVTQSIYKGTQRSMQVANVLFR
jgi:hypothetical protein